MVWARCQGRVKIIMPVKCNTKMGCDTVCRVEMQNFHCIALTALVHFNENQPAGDCFLRIKC